jgi:HECT-domain (ubiquitin-transferase)
LDPPLSHAELQRRYEEIENNKDFGRTALGKSYDLSFKEYFEERTFVDPLDPTQGENAVPLCEKGYSKQVTIYNIREWVSLAKYFFLYDGVISQALAFRQGVEDLFPAKFLNIFTAVELQRDVCGTGGDVDNWDESAVRKLFKLDGM